MLVHRAENSGLCAGTPVPGLRAVPRCGQRHSARAVWPGPAASPGSRPDRLPGEDRESKETGMKISRRTMLAGSAAAAATPLLAVAAGKARAATPPATVSFSIKNNTGSNTVYAFVTGLAINNNNAWMLLKAHGRTPYYPPT